MVFIPKTYTSIKDAVKLWCSNQTEAQKTYGHISTWDTSNVRYMDKLFQDCKNFNDDKCT